MNIRFNKTLLATAMGVLMIAGAANAADQGSGKVTFHGSIIDAPCSITPETVDQTVELGQVSSASLENGGKSSPATFHIDLENCDTATASTVTATFSGTPSVANPDLLSIVGTAAGASIGITNSDGNLIKLGEASAPTTIGGSTAEMLFGAYLQGNGASATIVPGEFTSVANFTLAYQ